MAKIVVADYEYIGEDDSQLTFKEGDRIVVLEQDEPTGWWTGRLEKSGVEGYFPSTYVKPVEESGPPPVPPVAPGDGYDGNATGLGTMYPPKHSPIPSRSMGDVELEAEEKAPNIPKISSTQPSLKEGGGATSVTTPAIDYNNYFANAQKVCSVPDDFEGDSSAAMENYYSAEVLNLNFNPNSKSRFGVCPV